MNHLSDPVFDRAFTGHTGSITSIDFKPFHHSLSDSINRSNPLSNKRSDKPHQLEFASGSTDHSIILWRYRPHLSAYRLLGHSQPITRVAYRPINQSNNSYNSHLASASLDGTIRIWSTDIHEHASHSCHIVRIASNQSSNRPVQVNDLDWDCSGSWLAAACSDDRVRIYAVNDVSNQSSINTSLDVIHTGSLYGHLESANKCRFSVDGRLIVSASDDGTVRLWDLERLTENSRYVDRSINQSFDQSVSQSFNRSIIALAVHPDGNLFASVNDTGQMSIIDCRSSIPIQQYQSPVINQSNNQSIPTFIGDVAFHPNGQFLYTTCSDGSINIYDLSIKHLSISARAHQTVARCVAIHADGQYFASGGDDQAINQWTHQPATQSKSKGRAICTDQLCAYDDRPAIKIKQTSTKSIRKPNTQSINQNFNQSLAQSRVKSLSQSFPACAQHSTQLLNQSNNRSTSTLARTLVRPASNNRFEQPNNQAYHQTNNRSSYSHSHTGMQSGRASSYTPSSSQTANQPNNQTHRPPISQSSRLPQGPMMHIGRTNQQSNDRSINHLHAFDVDDEIGRLPRDCEGTLIEIQKRLESINVSINHLDQRLWTCEEAVDFNIITQSNDQLNSQFNDHSSYSSVDHSDIMSSHDDNVDGSVNQVSTQPVNQSLNQSININQASVRFVNLTEEELESKYQVEDVDDESSQSSDNSNDEHLANQSLNRSNYQSNNQPAVLQSNRSENDESVRPVSDEMTLSDFD